MLHAPPRSHRLGGRLLLGAILPSAFALSAFAPREARAVVLASQFGCQSAVSKAARNYLASVAKLRTKCLTAELAASAPGACADSKVVKSLGDAASKFRAAVLKGCGTLGDEALTSPRPAGLSLPPAQVLVPRLRSELDRLESILESGLHGGSDGAGSADAAALSCQAALDRAVLGHLGTALKSIGSSCHDKEDRGRPVVDETFRIVEACRGSAEPALAAARAKLAAKTVSRCPESALAQLSVCRGAAGAADGVGGAAVVLACLFDSAERVAVATIAAEHGRDEPRVIGRIELRFPGSEATYAASDALVSLVDAAGETVASARADANGRVELPGRRLAEFWICWERDGARACASERIAVGLDTTWIGDRVVDVPELPSATGPLRVLAGRLERADGSPCFEAATSGDFALRGTVQVFDLAGGPAGEIAGVSPRGDFVVFHSSLDPFVRLLGRCGGEEIPLDVPTSSPGVQALVLRGSNAPPAVARIDLLHSSGQSVTDLGSVRPGEEITLVASFEDPDEDPLEFRWEVTRGDGSLLAAEDPVSGGGGVRASGEMVRWRIGETTDVHQLTVWASDGRGGLESAVVSLGPIVLPGPNETPCLPIPKLQKFLCGTGYSSIVPEPAGGRSNFLSYKYRNPVHNSPADACAYYNLVDPQCPDLDCDGFVDAGADPSGLCRRTTLGGWWQKNGFDPSTGLGPDVTSAWYLNSNDLGFGREMHCRVTSWRSTILDRPIGAPLATEFFLGAMRREVLESVAIADWKKLLPLFPSTVACYVVNYTTDACFNYPTNDPQNADLAYQGTQSIQSNASLDPLHAYGTVAMEFAPVEGFADLGPITKFFVYDGRIATGKRLAAANLDGCGPKSVPEVCLNCHGGNWPGDGSQAATLDAMIAGLGLPGGTLSGIDANDTALADPGYQLRRGIIEKLTREEYGFSSFLPFDPETYQFPSAAPFASQAASIRRLNQLVLWAKPKDAISSLVRGWYGNNLVSGSFAPWRPAAWNDDPSQPGDESDLHDDVYARACRGCHAAHYSIDQPTWFPSPPRLCVNGLGEAGGSPTMPHAKLTYLNLWRGDYPQAGTLPTLEAWYAASGAPGFTSCD